MTLAGAFGSLTDFYFFTELGNDWSIKNIYEIFKIDGEPAKFLTKLGMKDFAVGVSLPKGKQNPTESQSKINIKQNYKSCLLTIRI